MKFKKYIKDIKNLYIDIKKSNKLEKEFFVEIKKVEKAGMLVQAYKICNDLQNEIKLANGDFEKINESYSLYTKLCKELKNKCLTH